MKAFTVKKTKEKQNVYAGKKFRGITKEEHKLVVQVERHFINMINGKDLDQIPKEIWIQTMMGEMCERYPEETAEKGFYQPVMYENKECYAIHPDVMNVFQDIVGRVYAEYAFLGKEHLEEIIKKWNQTFNFIENVII